MPKYKVELLQEKDKADWQEYAYESADSNFFHLVEWQSILEKAYGYKPYYLIAKNNQQKTVGLMPIFLIKSLLFGHSLKSLPFNSLGGPIYDNQNALIALLQKAKQINDGLHIRNFQFKSTKNLDQNNQLKKFNIKIIISYPFLATKLDHNYELIYKKFSNNIRRNIKKGIKNNIIIEVKNESGLKNFYNLFFLSNKQKGLPSHSYVFFKEILNNFYKNGFCRLTLAKYQDKYVAGLLALIFKKRILYMWGAQDQRYKDYASAIALHNEIIKWGCQNGYQYYDFGWTHPIEKGIMGFKSQWNARIEKSANFYSVFNRPEKIFDYHTSFKQGKIFWRCLPLSTAKYLNNFLVKHGG